MGQFLAIGLGGFAGALGRFHLSRLVQKHTDGDFPAGTLCVNVFGCLLIGVFLTLALEREAFSDRTREFVVVGLLGSLTTFSAFGWDTYELARGGHLASAAANVGLNVALGLVAVFAGVALGRALA